MKKPKSPRKRNPQDSTLINIRSLKKRVAKLEKDNKYLMSLHGMPIMPHMNPGERKKR